MIILVKGQSNVGKTSLPQRLADSLELPIPAWPVSEQMLEDWQRVLDGWWESDPDFFVKARHIDVDRLVGLLLYENRLAFPPPPTSSTGMSRRSFVEWREWAAAQILGPKYLPRLFEVICDMIESADHVVINGTALGVTPRDSMLCRMILFKYSRVDALRILVKRAAYDGPDPPEGAEIGRTAVVAGKTYTHDRLLELITRSESGEIRLAPEFGVGEVGAPHSF